MPVTSRNAADGQMALMQGWARVAARVCVCELHVREKSGATRVGPRLGGGVGSSRSLAARQQSFRSPQLWKHWTLF